MAIYNKQATFTQEEFKSHFLRRDTLLDQIYSVVRFIGIVIENIYCVSSYLVLSLIVIFPISWFRSDIYSKVENYLYNSLLYIVSSWSIASGLTVVETGDDYKSLIEDTSDQTKGPINKKINSSLSNERPRVLLLCNHISTADVPLIMQSFSTMTNQSVLWVLDAQFKPTNFGLCCASHGDFFIAKNAFTDGSLRDHVLKYPDRNLFVLFPEGGFLRKRLEGSNRYAARNKLPPTKYVTHPRFGAFKDLIDPSIGVTHIIDTTLIYDNITKPPSILDIALGNRQEPVILQHKIYKRSEINPTEEWLREIWLSKDKFLEQYYENRDSIQKNLGQNMRIVKLDWIKIFAVHLFYLLVCYLTIYRLLSATRITFLEAKNLYYLDCV